ncbi:DUF2752 domain-containing protein [Nocardioides sp. SLBN-35]|jgi:hypothetical protein|uniref:DUF2752 domain-containing protein n=1 Tax=Nocardioides sp. SLBN-35 TaxID=2768445 RepID=UPI001153A80F|nr:DUF2752 domain-containing protein [Nocardioides sp. SLBN-35]TQK70708.1 uncharacterized protein DUF2752 [Nocardioides sp. SLBN-35]
MVPPALVVGGLAAATLALHLRDPHEQGSWGLCPSAAIGIYCPGCGGLRAVNDLTDLQLGAAASSNLLFVVALPFVLYAMVRWTHGRWTGRAWSVPDRRTTVLTVGLVGVMLLFAVVRNTPAGSWLAP